jgi:hypothetical protein
MRIIGGCFQKCRESANLESMEETARGKRTAASSKDLRFEISDFKFEILHCQATQKHLGRSLVWPLEVPALFS